MNEASPSAVLVDVARALHQELLHPHSRAARAGLDSWLDRHWGEVLWSC